MVDPFETFFQAGDSCRARFLFSTVLTVEAIASREIGRMNHLSKLRSAHMGAVNSVFVNLEAGVVIGLDEDSIRIWDPVKGVELHAYDAKNTDDVIISGMTSMYRFV